jgi:hypothetical protein
VLAGVVAVGVLALAVELGWGLAGVVLELLLLDPQPTTRTAASASGAALRTAPKNDLRGTDNGIS